MLRLAFLVLPLCLDTFAVAAALGTTSLAVRDRIRLGLLFAVFEGAMPLLGLLGGAALARLVGPIADYAAAAALALLGLYMLRGEGEAGEERARSLARATGFAMLGLGLSISLDELAMGFTLGLLRVPVVPAVAAIAAQAFLVTQLGLALGRLVGDRLREGAERLAGAVLLVLALAIAAGHVTGRGLGI